MNQMLFVVASWMVLAAQSQADQTPKRSLVARPLPAPTVERLDHQIDESLPGWLDFYKDCHQHPELSLQEKQSADHVAKLLAATGVRVTTSLGGHGVVGVLENGKGPTLLIRADMDALPITEETDLPFASKVTVTQPDGTKVGVMHACGHDVHQTVLIGTAQMLAALKDHWRGKVLFIAQPAEEIGVGALAMIQAGLFEKFGKPDACIALHVMPELEAGTVGTNSGWVYANVDSVNITIHGRGGHGARPHETVDPIVAASQIVLALQTIVSRRMDPREPSVVTVGSFHAGSKHNIIPDEARLQITVRSYTDEARRKLLDSIRQITTDVAKAAGCDRPPDVTVLEGEFTPATFNDPALTTAGKELFTKLLGAERVFERPPSMGGEDFSQYARRSGAPAMMFQLGVVESGRFAASKQPGAAALPSIHSSRFQVDPAPTLRTGVRCMTGLALSLLGPDLP